MQKLTEECPKPLLPVGGKPVLVHIINWLARNHITEIGINLHYLADTVIRTLGDGRAQGVELTYSVEETLLGTAGALRGFTDFLEDTFVVVYGDVLTNLDLTAMMNFHQQHHAKISIALYRVEDPSRCGIVATTANNQIEAFIEKPKPDEIFTDLANGGVYIIEPDILDEIPPKQFYDFGHDLFPKLLSAAVPMYGYPIAPAYLIDMGTPATFAQAERDFAIGRLA